ncbi:hypothetical protein EV363DRAFT_78773 [Boletus edulis]|nr:hypothetical protein EV363DRAFT_78773 [Boletus edulis]
MPKSLFPCDVAGCGMELSREYELRKHKALHEGSKMMLYCKWEDCEFYTLSPRYFKIHLRTHKGEQPEECTDTITLFDPSGSCYREIQCPYKTHDPSLLSKHRQRAHDYKPIPRARPTPTDTLQFVHYNPLPSSGSTTDDATSRAGKPKRARKRKPAFQRSSSSENADGSSGHVMGTAPESCLPRTLQQGANGYGQVDVLSPDTSGPNVASFTNSVPIHARTQAYAERLEAAGSNSNTWTAPNLMDTHWESTYVASLHATGSYTGSSITPITPRQPQGHVPFNTATNFQGPWSTFGVEMYTASFTTETYGYNHVANAQMQTNTLATTNGFDTHFSENDSHGYELWDAPQW